MTKKLSLEMARDKIRRIDAQIATLVTQRESISASITIGGGTCYRRGKPNKPGVYHYSSVKCAPMGGAQGYWNGTTWEPLCGWGDFTNRGEIVWHGEGLDGKQPIR